MLIPVVLGSVAAGVALTVAALYAAGRWLQGREPYGSFLRLSARQKLGFFRRLLKDRRVPWYVKAVPFAVGAYLATPIDLIPDFVPVLGYLDDVAVVLAGLAIVVRLTPPAVVDDILRDLRGETAGASPAGGSGADR